MILKSTSGHPEIFHRYRRLVDVIFVGCPIWWNSCSIVLLNTFIES
ncbi:MAG: flavodoxin [Bacteroides fragilis]